MKNKIPLEKHDKRALLNRLLHLSQGELGWRYAKHLHKIGLDAQEQIGNGYFRCDCCGAACDCTTFIVGEQLGFDCKCFNYPAPSNFRVSEGWLSRYIIRGNTKR